MLHGTRSMRAAALAFAALAVVALPALGAPRAVLGELFERDG